MDLRGWDYTGRNIGPELHRQYRIMVECLMNDSFVNHATWGNPIQEKLAEKMGMSSSGAVRTVKRLCASFGFFKPGALSSRTEIDPSSFLSERGRFVFETATLESQIERTSTLDKKSKERALSQVKSLYEEAYCDALMNYYFEFSDGSRLCPLRATLRALNKYGTMDKWEWYLLNTYIRKDDDYESEKTLDKYIKMYRNQALSFSMGNVIEKPKGHQYTPQYFEYAGLLHVIQRPEWSISDSNRHKDIKATVLQNDYLTRLYGR